MKPNENPNIRDLPEHYIVLDIETTGLLPLEGDRITCIGAKTGGKDFFIRSEKSEVELFYLFGEWIEWKQREDREYFLVTKNGKEFDVPFIMNRNSILGNILLEHFIHFDLHHVTSKWVGLQQMAELYGVDQKSGTGENAIKLWNEGRLDELKEYCWQDVLTTEQVFLKWKELHIDTKTGENPS